MFNSPLTDNPELDAFLYDVKAKLQEIDLSNVLSADTNTGQVINTTTNEVVSYLYKYIDIKFADDNAGSGITDIPVGKYYYGVYNTSSPVESINPASYTWYYVPDGFGLTKLLWVLLGGGRTINFAVSESTPDSTNNWKIVPSRSIDLDKPIVDYSQYMTIKFSENSNGEGMSDSSINALYYGIYTSTSNISSDNYLDYEWVPAAFGTTKEVYYRAFGARSIDIIVTDTKPFGFILYNPLDIINLDVPTQSTVTSLGIISDNPAVVESPYGYLLLRYADDNQGTGITTDPTGKTHFGLQASSTLTVDDNPADYTWFDTAGTLGVTSNLWARISGFTVEFNFSFTSPDSSGWKDCLQQENVFEPYIDVLSRSGSVVVGVTSPVDGRLYNSITNADGTTTLALAPFGQGSTTNGFEFDPASTSSISVDQFGRVIQTGAIDEIRYSSTITTATSGQTVFSFTNNQPNQIMVFRNGVFLEPGVDYTRTNLSVTLTNACTTGDTIQLYYIRLISASTSADLVPFTTHALDLTSGQTIINVGYLDGSELLFLNGALIVDTDYSYTGTNQGYTLRTPATGGRLCIVTFSVLNTNALIFGENYIESTAASTNISFPTSFYRNSSLIWLNGALLRPTSDYSIPGSGAYSTNITLSSATPLTGEPAQFCSFKSAGPASVGSLGSAGVLGFDQPVEIEKKPTMLDMFKEMQTQIDQLNNEIKILKGQQ